jgi:hypothetical protein
MQGEACPTCGSRDPHYYHDGLRLHWDNGESRCPDPFHSPASPEGGPVTCDFCGEPISESDQDLMIENMHEACYEESHGDE